MRPPAVIVVAAIVSLTTLELFALAQGINGALFALIVAAVSGLGGYTLRGLIRGGKTGTGG